MNLSGKTILVTRATHQAEDFVHAIEQRGGRAVLFPTIEITPPDSWNDCDRALSMISLYDGFLFASVNGVEFFFGRVYDRGIAKENLTYKHIYAVGRRTKEAIERHGFHVSLIPDKFTASDLVRALKKEDVAGKRFLFPRGNLGNATLAEGLRAQNAIVDTVEVYQTIKPKAEHVAQIYARLVHGEIDIVTVASPSAVRNFASLFTKEMMDRIYQHTAFAVIGPVTANALTQLGFVPQIVAHQSTINNLIEAMILHSHPEFEKPSPK